MTGTAVVTVDLTAEQTALVRQELLLGAPQLGGFSFQPSKREEIITAVEELRAFLDGLDRLGWEDKPTSLSLPTDTWAEIARSLFTQAGEQMTPHNDGDLRGAYNYVAYVQLAAAITDRLPVREPVEA